MDDEPDYDDLINDCIEDHLDGFEEEEEEAVAAAVAGGDTVPHSGGSGGWDDDYGPPDDGYDEGAFEAAYEEEAERRIQRQNGGTKGSEGGGGVGTDGKGKPKDAVAGRVEADHADGPPPLSVIATDAVGRRTPTTTTVAQSSSKLYSVSSSTSGRESHLYGFERFVGRSGWRTEEPSSSGPGAASRGGGFDEMRAAGWKKTTASKKTTDAEDDEEASSDGEDFVAGRAEKLHPPESSSSSGKKKTSSAPDAQLVGFLDRHCGTSSSRSAARSSFGRSRRFAFPGNRGSGYLLPAAGRPSVAVTVADGTRLYVPTTFGNAQRGAREEASAGSSLLGVPMSVLLRKSDAIERRAERRRRERDERQRRRQRGEVGGVGEDEEAANAPRDRAADDDATCSDAAANSIEQQRLWVDKHAPTLFSHLLSDERTNREVLRALRAWDPYVFKRAPPPRPSVFARFGSNGNSNGGDAGGSSVGGKKESASSSSSTSAPSGGQAKDPESDKPSNDVRPDERIRVILLSGPPGVGKTTLAHIVCRHAGYRPLEVNASDERSASVLTDRVVRAMESSTLNLKRDNDDDLHGRPNCLILDEIDGADAKSSISALVDIIRAGLPARGSSKGGGGGGSKSNKNNNRYLRRPIIFICNHKYSPALRPLLPYARQFDVKPPSATRLVARLRAVLSAENASLVGGGALLHKLVSGTGGDIRSCLYALQFASARAREVARKTREDEEERGGFGRGGGGTVDISQALGMALGGNGRGMKDERNDAAGTISTVFRKVKKRRGGDAVSARLGGEDGRDVERILRTVDCFGDNSKTLDCLFMNVLRVSYVDPTLDRCFSAHEWLSGADVYRSHKTLVASNNNSEHQSMQKFHIPTAAAAIHLLCRVETRADLTFSTRPMTDAHYQLQANGGLVNRFVEGLAPKARVGIGGTNCVTDVIPYSLWLLSAGKGMCSLQRAVSSIEIMNKSEKLAFKSHVATLRALGLTYVKVKDETSGDAGGIAEMRLEPEIDQFVRFEKYSPAEAHRRKEIPHLLKELLAHGANLEYMRERENEARRAERMTPKKVPPGKENNAPSRERSPKHQMDSKKEVAGPPIKRTKTSSIVASKNFLGIGAAKAKAARTARKAALVGFDRSKKIKLSNSGSGLPLSKVIRFKYQKGFTQAVRVPCKMEDLL